MSRFSLQRGGHVGPGDEHTDGLHAFVSYSRADSAFVDGLVDDLHRAGLHLWIDREDIPASARWREELLDGIRRSDTLIFIVSPDSVASKVCLWELEQAEELHKRIIPVRCRAVRPDDVPQAVSSRQWLDAADPLTVVEAVRTDPERIRAHSRLLVQAADWEGGGRRRTALLRGRELAAAREWVLLETQAREPTPTELQRTFLAAGLRAAHQRRALGVAGVALTVVAGLVFGLTQVRAYREDSSRRLAQIAVEQRDDRLDTSLLLARAALQQADTLEARSALLGAVRTNPRLRTFIHPPHPRTQRFGEDTAFAGLAQSPDGALIAVARPYLYGDPAVDIVELASRRTLGTAASMGSANLTFSRDGTLVASSEGGHVTVAEVRSTRTLEPLPIPSGPPVEVGWFVDSTAPTAMAFTPTGHLVVAGPDAALRSADVHARQWAPAVPTGHAGAVRTLAFSPDGRLLVSGGADGRLVLHHADTGVPQGAGPVAQFGAEIRSLAFDPGGRLLAVGTNNGQVSVVETGSWQPVAEPFNDHGGDGVEALAFSPDGRLLASAGRDDTATVRETDGWLTAGAPLTSPGLSGTAIAFGSNPGRLVWGLRADDALAQWDIAGPGPLARSPTGPGNVSAIAINPTDGAYAVADPDGPVSARGRSSTHNATNAQPVLAVAWSGSSVISAAGDGSVNFWAPDTGDPPTTRSIGAAVSAVALDPAGKRIAAATYSDRIVVRELDTWDVLVDIPEGEGNVISLAFSDDARLLAVGTELGGVSVVDVDADRRTLLAGGHHDYVQDLAFSGDGSRLASVSSDDTIIVWDVPGLRQATEALTRHTEDLRSVAFSPDASLVAVGTEENQVVLWDIAGRREFGVPLRAWPHTSDDCVNRPCMPVEAVVFSADGRSIAAGTVDEGIVLWNLDPTEMAAQSCLRAGRDLSEDERVRWSLPTSEPCAGGEGPN